MTKRVFFFRHGEADWPGWDGPDDDRPLTKKGKAEVKRVARFLRRVGAEPLLVFTSPLPRAAQTAKIVAKQLCLECGIENSLGKGFNAEKFRRIVAQHDVTSMVLVGHEPDFSSVVCALTGADVVLRKSGVALVETDEPFSDARLLWLFPPQFAKREK
jgi:phosphohistidine phosphatase